MADTATRAELIWEDYRDTERIAVWATTRGMERERTSRLRDLDETGGSEDEILLCLLMIARFMSSRRKFASAIPVYERAMRTIEARPPGRPIPGLFGQAESLSDIEFSLALCHVGTGNHATAIEILERLVTPDGNNEDLNEIARTLMYRSELGRTYGLSGDERAEPTLKKVIASYEQIDGLSSLSISARHDLAWLYNRQNRLEEAESILREVLASHLISSDGQPCVATVSNNLSLVLSKMSNHEEAEQHYRRALVIMHKFRYANLPICLDVYAGILQETGRSEDAADVLLAADSLRRVKDSELASSNLWQRIIDEERMRDEIYCAMLETSWAAQAYAAETGHYPATIDDRFKQLLAEQYAGRSAKESTCQVPGNIKSMHADESLQLQDLLSGVVEYNKLEPDGYLIRAGGPDGKVLARGDKPILLAHCRCTECEAAIRASDGLFS